MKVSALVASRGWTNNTHTHPMCTETIFPSVSPFPPSIPNTTWWNPWIPVPSALCSCVLLLWFSVILPRTRRCLSALLPYPTPALPHPSSTLPTHLWTSLLRLLQENVTFSGDKAVLIWKEGWNSKEERSLRPPLYDSIPLQILWPCPPAIAALLQIFCLSTKLWIFSKRNVFNWVFVSPCHAPTTTRFHCF